MFKSSREKCGDALLSLCPQSAWRRLQPRRPHGHGCRRGPSLFQARQDGNIPPFSLKAVVPPWHSKCSSDPPATAEWTLQSRGTRARGQHHLLRPDPGRNPCYDPRPGSSGTTHHPPPRRTDWQHHPAPLSPTECSATCTHFTARAENWPQATPGGD